MSKPIELISVIIPTLDSAKTITNAIDSILQQTFDDFEILIIDGLSEDNTIPIARSYSDKRIRIFSEKDNGIYDAMNKGIKLSKGEWLYFLGSDDKLYNNTVFEDISELLYLTKSKAVYGNVIMRGDNYWAKDKQVYDGVFDIQKILTKNIAHQAIFYYRDLFKQIGKFNTKYKICADYDFNMQVMAKCNFQHTNTTVAYFTAGGMSTKEYDHAFARDFSDNIINYFHSHLHRKFFFTYRHNIFQKGVSLLKTNKLKGLWLILVALKFYLQYLIKKIYCCFGSNSASVKANIQCN